MATDKLRNKRLEELVHQLVASIINEVVETPPETFITVKDVMLSANHQHATVRVSVYPFEKSAEALSLMQNNIREIQHRLNQKLQMRPVPKLQFELDDSEQRAQKIYSLLDEEEAN